MSHETKPLLLSSADLGRLLGIEPTAIRTRLCRDPGSLPPAVRLPGMPHRLYWRPLDVERWIADLPPAEAVLEAFKSTKREIVEEPVKRRRGRPSKAEQIARRGSGS